MMADSDLESRDEEFSIDEVRSKLHGQLEIQAVTGVPSPPLPAWLNERSKYLPASSNYDPELASAPRSSRSESGPSEDEPHFSSGTFKREVPDSWHSENGSEGRETEPRDLAIRPEGEVPGEYRALLKRERLASQEGLDPRAFEYEPVPLQVSSVRKGSKDGESFDRDIDSEKKGGGTGQPSSSSLLDAARAAGLEISPSSSDPMSSISALLAAAQATGGIPSPSSTGAPTATSTQTKDSTGTSKTPGGAAAAAAGEAGPSQGLDLSNPAAAMANVNVSHFITFKSSLLRWELVICQTACTHPQLTRHRCSCTTTCRSCRRQGWATRRKGRSVPYVGKHSTTVPLGTATCAFIQVIDTDCSFLPT